MNVKDLQRVEVLTVVLAGRRSVASAAAVLAISDRQVNRLVLRYCDGDGVVLIHRARGRSSKDQFQAGIRDYAVALIRQGTATSGPAPRNKCSAGMLRIQHTPGDRSYGGYMLVSLRSD